MRQGGPFLGTTVFFSWSQPATKSEGWHARYKRKGQQGLGLRFKETIRRSEAVKDLSK